jgi:FkbM family methyltransferase
MKPKSVIYDFGRNNGDDVEYYLLKADKVVGVEANPILCDEVRRRFPAEIAEDKLIVVNCALSTDIGAPEVDFYVNRKHHVLSQLDKPDVDAIGEFEQIRVPAQDPVGIIHAHGDPPFVKIDLEGFDAQVLRAIFAAGIRPPEISAESHSIDVFASLVEAGYRSFNLVDGWSIAHVYNNASIETLLGRRRFSFRPHSAGPFGADVRGEWQDPDTFFYTLAAAGLGWKDIHASNLIPPAPPPSFGKLISRQAAALVLQFARGVKAWVSKRD